jgi:hypothetical protein
MSAPPSPSQPERPESEQSQAGRLGHAHGGGSLEMLLREQAWRAGKERTVDLLRSRG